jgi:hypothetical protein
MSEFCEKFPRTFRKWKKKSGYLICLAVKDLTELEALCLVLDSKKIKYCKFFEPDVNQVTAIAIAPSPEADHITRRIRLAGQKVGKMDKHMPLLKAS